MFVKKKILFVGNCQTTHLRRWVKYLSGNFEVTVISSRLCGHAECLLFDEIIPVGLRRLASFPKIGFLLKSFFLNKYLRSRKIDLVHILQLGGFESRLGKILVFTGFHPLVVSTWGSDVVGLEEVEAVQQRRHVLENADLVTATSGFLAKETKELAPGIRRLETVPFGVDLDVFDPKRFKRGRSAGGALRIGFFKHLEPKYGPEYLLGAFGIVSKKFPNAELFIAGQGGMGESLKTLAGDLGVSDRTHFLGFINNVAKTMSSMDVTAMPSLTEAFGVAAIESEALEVPVIASRVGGVPEVVLDGKTGFLVPSADLEALAESMIKILSNEKLRLQMGKSGRKFVCRYYDWSKNASEMERLYKELLGRSKFRDI